MHLPLSQNKPVIAHVYPYFHRRGGVERYLWELTKALASNGYEQIVVCATAEPMDPSPVRFLKLPSFTRPKFLANVWFAILSTFVLFKKHPGRIINVQGANRLRQDVITAQSVHKTWFNMSRIELPTFSKRWWFKILNPVHYFTIAVEFLQFLPGNYRKIIAISQNVKTDLMRAYGIPAEHIAVVYSGVNCDEFSPAHRARWRAPMRTQFGLAPTDFVLCFVANEFKRKGLETIISAMDALIASYPHLKLVVVGKDHIEAMWQRPYAIHVGPSGNVNQFFAMADAFVFPTVYEAFGLVILEAMAAGLPVITSKGAGAAELMQHQKDGLLLDDPRDVAQLKHFIELIAGDPTRAQSLGDSARQTALEHTWQRVAQETIAVYQELSS